MKKIISIILMAAIFFGVATTTPLLNEEVYAATLIDGNYTYTVASGGATITKCSDSTSTDIIIPSTLGGYTVSTLNSSAFKDCSSLVNVTVPSSITTINDYAFSGCSALTKIIVDSANASFSSDDGVLFNKAKTNLLICPEGEVGNYSIPATVKSVGIYAFRRCSKLTGITVPSGLTYISSFAFMFCSSLDSVTVDSGNTTYSSDNGVLFKKLKTQLVVYPAGKTGEYSVPNSVTSINDYAFYYCSGLTSVSLPSSVTSIGTRAFMGCSGLTSICLPAYVTSISPNMFYYCINLKSIDVDSGNIKYLSVDGVVFDKAKTELIVCPPGIVGNYSVPDGITTIGSYAFSTCSGLESITVPNSVTYIGSGAFSACSGLESITVPNSVTSIHSNAFDHCSILKSINVDSGNVTYSSIDGVVFDKAKTKMVVCPPGIVGKYSVPDGITTIGEYAFSTCTGLTNIIMPDSVTSIDTYAFTNCSGLTSIAMPDSVTSIGVSAFANCSGLTSVTIPYGVTAIPKYAFAYCINLTSVVLPNTVTAIEATSFYVTNKPTLYFKDSEYLKSYCASNNVAFVVVDDTHDFQLFIKDATYDSINKSMAVTVGVYNANAQNIDTTLLLAIYDMSGKLVKVQRYNLALSEQAITIDKTLTSVQGIEQGYGVKALLWNDMDSMTPIAMHWIQKWFW